MNEIKKIVYSALFLALAMILPFLTGQIPEIGSMLCPLHIPAILCGFICGWPYGLIVGFMSPLLRSFIFIMPPIQVAIPMAFEIGIYGMVSGYLYNKLPRNKLNIYIALITSMILGRIVWGIIRLGLVGFDVSIFGWQMFVAGAITTALPGIILQLILIPLLIMVYEKHNRINK